MDEKQQARFKEVMRWGVASGPRAVATGAVLYTAVRAAFVGGRFIRARRGEVASATKTTTPRSRAQARESSLALPNQRWQRIGAARS